MRSITGTSTWDLPSREPDAASTPTTMEGRLAQIESELVEARTILSLPAANAINSAGHHAKNTLSVGEKADDRAAGLLVDELANILEFVNSKEAALQPRISLKLQSSGNQLAVMLAEQIYRSVGELKRQESTSSRLLHDALVLLEEQKLASKVSNDKHNTQDSQEVESDFDYIYAQLPEDSTIPTSAGSTQQHALGGDASTNEGEAHWKEEAGKGTADTVTAEVVSMSEHLRVVTLNQRMEEELSRYRLQTEQQQYSEFVTPPKTSVPRLQQLFMPEMDGFDELVSRSLSAHA